MMPHNIASTAKTTAIQNRAVKTLSINVIILTSFNISIITKQHKKRELQKEALHPASQT
jgi:hypothetical protein